MFQILRFLNFYSLVSYPKLTLAGMIIGYLCYDMIHYFIHFASPTSDYFYNLKRYHNNHHFVHHDKGFGISNSFWDGLFSTKAMLNRLNYRIQWQKAIN